MHTLIALGIFFLALFAAVSIWGLFTRRKDSDAADLARTAEAWSEQELNKGEKYAEKKAGEVIGYAKKRIGK